MSNNNNKYDKLDSLKQLRKNMSFEEFGKLFTISESSMKAYEYGHNRLPIEQAILIADKFNVSLDWIYGRSKNMTENDLMLSILLCLDKVFKIKMKTFTRLYKGEKVTVEENVLCVSKEFSDYIKDIQELVSKTTNYDLIDGNTYNKLREKIQNKHQIMLKNIFSIDDIRTQKDNDVIIGDADSVMIFGNIENSEESEK
ncbi:MAG: helix-turn-helix transcriptional regulator [Oscillospiraceae bacterium]|nr:helix-turn-helix transcriptional regulator [Oscillospiraceae bacterium]